MTDIDCFIRRDVCPGCASTHFDIIYCRSFNDPAVFSYLQRFYQTSGRIEYKYLEGVQFILAECRECGLIFQQFVPTEFLSKKLYEEWIDPSMAHQRFLQGRNLLNQSRCAGEIMMLIHYFRRAPGDLTFMDFGMGWGKWCLMAKAFWCQVYGIELSDTRIENAKRLGIDTLAWEELPEHRFDFINTEQVFEHITYPLNTLQYLAKCLKPRGLIKISVPDGRDIKRRLRTNNWNAPKGTPDSLNLVSPLEHINCYRYRSIMRLAHEAGLERVKIPLRLQYAYSISWSRNEETVKSLIRPLLRDIFNLTTYAFFTPRQDAMNESNLPTSSDT